MAIYRRRRGRKLRQVRRRGPYRAAAGAAVGAGGALYRFGRRAYQGINRLRLATQQAKFANRFVKNMIAGNVGKAITDTQGGDYQQREVVSLTSGKRPRFNLSRLTKEIKNNTETVIMKWHGAKTFDDNGYYWCGSGIVVDTGVTTHYTMPCYIFDLTQILQNTSICQPMKRANIVNTAGAIDPDSVPGNVIWSDVPGLSITGGSASTANFLIEKKPRSGSTDSAAYEKSQLLWTQIKMNLWGAKNKAIKYKIQLVKITDTQADPWEYSDYNQHTCMWQPELKNLVFNPICNSGQKARSKFLKVLKTYTKVIQPTSSTENDADPHVVTLKMFNRWHRWLNYVKNTSSFLNTPSTQLYDVDYVQTSGTQCTAETHSKDKIFLLIRAEVYTPQQVPDNTVTPSFDLVVRTCHAPNMQ